MRLLISAALILFKGYVSYAFNREFFKGKYYDIKYFGKCKIISRGQHGEILSAKEYHPYFRDIKKFTVRVIFEEGMNNYPSPYNDINEVKDIIANSIYFAFDDCMTSFDIEFITDPLATMSDESGEFGIEFYFAKPAKSKIHIKRFRMDFEDRLDVVRFEKELNMILYQNVSRSELVELMAAELVNGGYGHVLRPNIYPSFSNFNSRGD